MGFLTQQGVGGSGSGTLGYIPKFTPNGATLGNSIMYESTGAGIDFIAVGSTTRSSKNEKFHVRTTSVAYGFAHSNGTVVGGSYTGGSAFQFGSYTNHPVYFFVNDGTPSMTLNTNGKIKLDKLNATRVLTLDANKDITGVLGAVGGTFTTITSITVADGIVTEISGLS